MVDTAAQRHTASIRGAVNAEAGFSESLAYVRGTLRASQNTFAFEMNAKGRLMLSRERPDVGAYIADLPKGSAYAFTLVGDYRDLFFIVERSPRRVEEVLERVLRSVDAELVQERMVPIEVDKDLVMDVPNLLRRGLTDSKIEITS